jgi:hypothetical protein
MSTQKSRQHIGVRVMVFNVTLKNIFTISVYLQILVPNTTSVYLQILVPNTISVSTNTST